MSAATRGGQFSHSIGGKAGRDLRGLSFGREVQDDPGGLTRDKRQLPALCEGDVIGDAFGPKLPSTLAA